MSPSETTEPMGPYRPLVPVRLGGPEGEPWMHPFSQETDKDADMRRIDKRIVRVIREAKRGAVRWPLLFHGEPGSGKSCAGICMVRRFGGGYWWLSNWCDVWGDVSRGKREFRGESSGSTARLSDLERALRQLNLLVLDEVGANDNQFVYTRLHHLLELREGKPTVIISNKNMEELGDIYDHRVLSRLRAGTQIEFFGDRRVPDDAGKGDADVGV